VDCSTVSRWANPFRGGLKTSTDEKSVKLVTDAPEDLGDTLVIL